MGSPRRGRHGSRCPYGRQRAAGLRNVFIHADSAKGKTHAAWMEPLVNDRWEVRFSLGGLGRCTYVIAGAVNRFATWQHDLDTKHRVDGVDMTTEIRADLQLMDQGLRLAEGQDREQDFDYFMERRGQAMGDGSVSEEE